MAWVQSAAIGPYSAAFAAAVCVGLGMALREGRIRTFPVNAWTTVLASGLAAGIVGSKLVFLDFQPIAPGEKTVLGGLVVGILVTLAVARSLGIGGGRALDAMTVPTLAAMAIGRVGCFFAGCCAGTATTLPWAVESPLDGRHVHPTQLYEMLGDVVLALWVRRHVASRAPGQRVLMASLGYIGLRFGVEFFRAERELFGPLNVVQWSLLSIGIGVAALAIRNRRVAPTPTDARVSLPVSPSAALAPLAVCIGLATSVVLTGGWFTPVERSVMLVLAATMGCVWAAPLRGVHWRKLVPLLPLAAAPRTVPVLAVQAPASQEALDLLVGGSVGSSDYEQIVARYIDDCGGDGRLVADREAQRADVRVGLRRTSAAGRSVSLEGVYVGGRDRLRSDVPSPADIMPVPSAPTRAGGATFTVEGDGGMLRVGVLSGRLSQMGTPRERATPMLAFRARLTERWFIGGGAADRTYFPSTGEMSHIGIGFAPRTTPLRAYLSLYGEGARMDLAVPIRRSLLELGYRRVFFDGTQQASGTMITVGLTNAVSLRRRAPQASVATPSSGGSASVSARDR